MLLIDRIILLDPLYRAGIIQPTGLAQTYGKNQIHTIANIPSLSNGSSAYYNAAALAQQHSQAHQSYYNNITANTRNSNLRVRFNTQPSAQQSVNVQGLARQALHRQGGYQLKVGGVVVGSWAGGAPNRGNAGGVQSRFNRTNGASGYARYPINVRGRGSVNSRLQRNTVHNQHVSSLARTISRNTYGVKANRNRNRRNRKERKGTKPSGGKPAAKKDEKSESGGEQEEEANDEETIEAEGCTQNG